MKAFAAAVVVLLILALLGWYTLFADGDRAGVDVNPDVAAEDIGGAAEAIGEGAEAVKETAEKVEVDVDVSTD